MRKRTENPKTVLAFLATALGIAAAFVLAVLSAAAFAGEWSTGLAIFLIALFFVMFVLIVGGVFYFMKTDVSRLMLGRVTGEEYQTIQRAILGDSQSGERAVITSSPVEQTSATGASKNEPIEVEIVSDSPSLEPKEDA